MKNVFALAGAIASISLLLLAATPAGHAAQTGIKGEIVAVDLEAGTIEVREGDGERTATVAIPQGHSVRESGVRFILVIEPGSLHPGASVWAKGKLGKDGKALSTRNARQVLGEMKAGIHDDTIVGVYRREEGKHFLDLGEQRIQLKGMARAHIEQAAEGTPDQLRVGQLVQVHGAERDGRIEGALITVFLNKGELPPGMDAPPAPTPDPRVFAIDYPKGIAIYTTGEDVTLKVMAAKLTPARATHGTDMVRIEDNLGREIALYAVEADPGLHELSLDNPGPGFYRIHRGGRQVGAFGVYLPPDEYPNSEATGFCIDCGINSRRSFRPYEAITDAWIENHIDLMRRAGLKYVRERYRPNHIHETKGAIDFDEVDSAALDVAGRVFRLEHETGIGVCPVICPTIPWLREDGEEYLMPPNLVDVYRYHYEAAKAFDESVDVWEIWNEVDLTGFYKGETHVYASFMKAASWGLRDGNPKAGVTVSSFAREPRGFHFSIFENRIHGYFDIFNYHTYGQPPAHYDSARKRIEFMNAEGIGQYPIYLTEVGKQVRANEPVDLPEPVARDVCAHMIHTFAENAAAGVDRTFYFIWWWYLNGHYGSMLDGNDKPTDRLATLATINRLLGDGRHTGMLDLGEGVRAHLFDAPDAPTLVLFRFEGHSDVSFDVEGDAHQYFMTGEKMPVDRDGDTVSVNVGPSPVFVRAEKILGDIRTTRIERKPNREFTTSRRVLDLRVADGDLDFDRTRAAYLFDEGATRTFTLTASNLSDKPWSGPVEMAIEGGWQTAPAEHDFELAPMSSASIPVTITAPAEASNTPFFRYTAQAPGDDALLAVRTSFMYQDMTPTRVRPLIDDFADAEFDLHLQQKGGVDGEWTRIEEGHRFRFTTTEPGKWWAFPRLYARPNVGSPVYDLTGWDALRVRINVRRIHPGIIFIFILEEPGGIMYGSPTWTEFSTVGEHEIFCVFDAMRWLTVSKPDPPDFHLNLDNVEVIHLGINTLGASRRGYGDVWDASVEVEYDILEVELLDYSQE